MPLSVPAQFLNLDLVLKSKSELSAISKYFDKTAFVLSHEEYNGEWTLVAELADELVRDPAKYTRRFLAIISELHDGARAAWNGCTSRTFAYGFDSGSNSPALEATISADLLLQIARVDADIGITVYPFRQS